MKTQIISKGLLGLAGLVMMSGAVVANADPEYAIFKGDTILTTNSGQLECYTTLAGTVDDVTGEVVIKAVGAVPGDPQCSGIYTGNLPWEATMSNTGANVSGTLHPVDTDVNGLGAPSTIVPAISEECYGDITADIDYTTGSSGLPVSVDIVPASGSNYGDCTIEGELTRRAP